MFNPLEIWGLNLWFIPYLEVRTVVKLHIAILMMEYIADFEFLIFSQELHCIW